MGRGNVRVDGPYEGLYYIDNENLVCFRPRDCIDAESDDPRLLKDIPGDQMSEWEYDDTATEWRQSDVEAKIQQAIRKRFPSFHNANEWLENSRRAILENNLFYIVVEDNEWSIAIELIQRDDPYSERLRGLQAGLFKKYLNGIRDALFEQFDTLGIYNGAWTSGRITKAECGKENGK